jgi:hypothetical protein
LRCEPSDEPLDAEDTEEPLEYLERRLSEGRGEHPERDDVPPLVEFLEEHHGRADARNRPASKSEPEAIQTRGNASPNETRHATPPDTTTDRAQTHASPAREPEHDRSTRADLNSSGVSSSIIITATSVSLGVALSLLALARRSEQ